MKKLKLSELKIQSMVTKEQTLNMGGVTGTTCYTGYEVVCNSGTCTHYAPCVPPPQY